MSETPFEEVDRIERRRSEGSRVQVWHLIASVLGIVLALLLQTGTAVWWAATISSDVRNEKLARAADKRTQKEIDSRQDDDARRSEDRRLAEVKEINSKLDWLIKNRR